METLQQKIEKLRQEDALEKQMASLFPTLKVNCRMNEEYLWEKYGCKYYVWAELDVNGFNKVLDHFKPTKESFTCDNDNIIIKSPFKIDIDNPAMYARFVNIQWQSGDYEIGIKIPENILAHFFTRSERNISDSEYHYFIGYSHNELRDTKLMKMNFKCDQINWYGGSCTCKDPEVIQSIIDFLTTSK